MNRYFRTMQSIQKAYSQDLFFSHELANTRLLETLCRYVRWTSHAQKKQAKKDKLILKALTDIVQPVLNQYHDSDNHGIPVENAPIWVFWWSGVKDAPALVQKCVSSIKDNADNHPVKIIDRNNINEYLDVDPIILEKVEKKFICLANFSDYVRFSLLNRYGGMWIDATILLSGTIPEHYFDRPLFTCNSDSVSTFISIGRWTAFVFGGREGHVLFQYMQDAFELYWKKQDFAIDYLLVDYLIRLAYENIPRIKDDIDAIPINNLHRNDLRAAMNRGEPAEKFDAYIFPDTCFNKLSWREKYQLVNPEGTRSVYAEFLDRY